MAQIKLDIGEAQIQNTIAIAIAESFSPEHNAQLIRDIVRAHLSIKEGTYDKETLLSKSVGKIIREIALDEVGKLLNEQDEAVRKIVRETLGKPFVESVLSQLKTSISNKVIANVRILTDLKDYE